MRNIFEAWVTFRNKIEKQNRSELVDYINQINGTRLTTAAISQYISGQKAVPDNILILIEDDYPKFISWMLTRSGIVASNKATSNLASLLKFPVKR